MKYINTSALALCVFTLVVVCGFVFSTGDTWTKFSYRSNLDGYRCVPNETIFEEDDIDPPTCGKTCHLNNQCRSFFYQPDNRQCIGCVVDLYIPLWTNRHRELPGSMHFRQKKQNLPNNCKAILENDPFAPSGPYVITVGDIVLKVYCDMTTDGGGWIVFQNRFDGSVDFYRNFSEYENGFGDISGEFWLGLRYIQSFADEYPSELWIVLTKDDGVSAYEHYKEFRLLEGTNYTLSAGSRSTNITDIKNALGFFHHQGSNYPFSTFDRDMDLISSKSCAVNWHGAWWFASCAPIHLNGEYCTDVVANCYGLMGLYHPAFAGPEELKKTKMMIRPKI